MVVQKPQMVFKPTLQSAIAFSKNGKMEIVANGNN
jgi:hypothetical protein